MHVHMIKWFWDKRSSWNYKELVNIVHIDQKIITSFCNVKNLVDIFPRLSCASILCWSLYVSTFVSKYPFQVTKRSCMLVNLVFCCLQLVYLSSWYTGFMSPHMIIGGRITWRVAWLSRFKCRYWDTQRWQKISPRPGAIKIQYETLERWLVVSGRYLFGLQIIILVLRNVCFWKYIPSSAK